MNSASSRALVLSTFVFSTTAYAADTTPPTVTVVSPRTVECAGNTTEVLLGPVISDNLDPLPDATYWNLSTARAWTDPASYPMDTTLVQIKACDHAGRGLTPANALLDNCTTKNVTVNVRDTTPPIVNLGPDVITQECTSPTGTPVPLTVTVTDRCDAAPSVSNTALATYPLGSTTVTYTATDRYGNVGTDTIRVVVRDSLPPVVDAGADFSVPVGSCPTSTGTQVILPLPKVTEACTAPEGLLFRNSFTNSPDRVVCLPNGSTTITWTVFDGQGRQGQDSVIVTVGGTLALTLTANGPSGFVNSDAVVSATASGTTVTQPLSWLVATDVQPTTRSSSGTTFSATFSTEASYCPLYLNVSDAGGRKGVNSNLCFAVDKQKPTFSFNSIANMWLSPTDPTVQVAVNPANSATWPVYFSSQNLPLEISAADSAGAVQSGVQTVRAIVDPNGSNTVVVNNVACTSTPAGKLLTCPETVFVSGCDQNTPACVTVSTPLPGGGNLTSKRLDLGALSLGPHVLRVEVKDQAGNIQSKDYYFRVGDLGDALDAEVAWSTAILANAGTPFASRTYFQKALSKFQTAKALYKDSTGHAFLLAQDAYSLLDQAQGAGANTATMKAQLAAGVAFQARRVIELTTKQGLTNWKPLREWEGLPPDAVRSQEKYLTRYFLITRGDPPITQDFVVDVPPTLALANHFADLADQQMAGLDGLNAIKSAAEANNALVMLFTDLTLADLFARAVRTVQDPQTHDTAVEAYYRGSRPIRFGDFIALSISAQITRVAFNPALNDALAIPAEARTTLGEVQTMISQFANSVGLIKLNGDDLVRLGFGNKAILEQVYLKGLLALEKLKTIQTSSVYTHQWMAAIALTVAFVGNFTLYEGPTSLLRLNDLTAWNGLPKPLKDYLGQGTCDANAQTSECRYNRIMSALMVGRVRGNVEAAVELYGDSKCLMVDVYNRYYAGRFFTYDTLINPATYGCTGAPGPDGGFKLAQECICLNTVSGGRDTICNGLDDDCDGQVDEDYVPQHCGFGPCASDSACINGREVACVPLTPSVSVDLTCDGVDDDCDGLVDDDWVADTCGFGGCTAQSHCMHPAGQPAYVEACLAATPHAETCNGLDDNCNLAIDEGLDEDHDGYGCAPGAAGCTRTLPLGPANPPCRKDDGVRWDCDDTNPDTFPGGPEICDYKDNNCNGLIDEGVRNECNHCGNECNSTLMGTGTGAVAFNPTPSNSDQITKKPDGTVSLSSEQVDLYNAYVANYGWGLVSKIDTRTGKEVGRYCSALKSVARGVSNVCAACNGCNSPSRSAVDLVGNVFIANRAFDAQGTYTKIAAAKRDCVDVNNNGIIETSTDVNNNGIIDQGDINEYKGENDECIIWTAKPTVWESGSMPAGAASGEGYILPRALAIDADGNPWVGAFFAGGFWQVSATTGKVKKWAYMGVNPYGGVVDRLGILWAPHSCCGTGVIAGYNTKATSITNGTTTWTAGQTVQPATMPWGDLGNYGIAVDGKNRVWVASYPAMGWAAARYDPSNKTWGKALVASPWRTSAGMGRGVTVDNANTVWVAQHGNWVDGRITSFNGDTLAIIMDVFTGTPGGDIPIGIGIGANNRIWAANQDGRNLVALDPVSGAIATYPNSVTTPTGQLIGNLYTYSDFTGNLARTFTAPKGSYSEIIEGCADHSPVDYWVKLEWTGSVPGSTHIKFQVRVAADKTALATATYYPTAAPGYYESALGTPIVISALPAWQTGNTNIKWAEVKVTLESDSNGMVPNLFSYRLVRNCRIP